MKTTFTQLAVLAVAVSLFSTGPAQTFSPNQNRPPQIRPQAPPQVVRPTIRPMVQVPAITDRVGRLHKQTAASNKKKKQNAANNKRKKTDVATNVRKKQDTSKKKRNLNEIARAPAQNLKKAVGQAGPVTSVIEPMPPLPVRKPMTRERKANPSVSLTAGLPGVSTGPQPEPPTDGSDGIDAAINDLFGRIGSELPVDVANFHVEEIMGGNAAPGAIGGGGNGDENPYPGPALPGRDDGRRPGPGTPDNYRREDDSEGRRPGYPGPGTNHPSNDEDGSGGFSGPGYSSPGDRYHPPSAGGGRVKGPDGRTSQDGESSEEEYSVLTTCHACEMGQEAAEVIDSGFDGKEDSVAIKVIRAVTARFWFPHVVLGGHVIDSIVQPFGPWPDDQPNPDPNAGGDVGDWCTGHGDCGSAIHDVTLGDKVSQPGGGEGGEDGSLIVDADGKSVAERTGVVTNPVDPEHYQGTGGGGGQPRTEWRME